MLDAQHKLHEDSDPLAKASQGASLETSLYGQPSWLQPVVRASDLLLALHLTRKMHLVQLQAARQPYPKVWAVAWWYPVQFKPTRKENSRLAPSSACRNLPLPHRFPWIPPNLALDSPELGGGHRRASSQMSIASVGRGRPAGVTLTPPRCWGVGLGGARGGV